MNLLMETEELHRKIHSVSSVVTNNDCFQILHDLDELLARLYSPQLTIDVNTSTSTSSNDGTNTNENENEIEIELRKHCLQKTTNVAMLALKLITTKSKNSQGKQEPDPEDDDYRADEERDCQSTVARIVELVLILCCDGDEESKQETTRKNIDEIVDMYSSYQRQVLRLRSKPSIARLVEYRKRQKHMMGTMLGNGNEEDDDDDDDNDNRNSSSSNQHIKVITTILGQATSLIYPLMMWRSNLPPQSALYKLCTQSIQTLDDQAQSLANTVATWLMEDSQINEYWMVQMSGGEDRNYNNQEESHSSSLDRITDIDLGALDSVVDRLAFCCQIFDRYIQLVVKENENHNHNNDSVPTTTTTILQQLHPEWTWKYASLERYLITQQLRSALHPNNNFPVEIVVGAKIQVPSFVEDGTYLSTRALKRAASTRSDQAIGTVAHSIASDVWTTDSGGTGIYEALVEQRGCYNPHNEVSSLGGTNNDNNTNNGVADSPSSNSNSFAQALLGALDDDTSSSAAVSTTNITRPPNSGSGGLLGTFSSSLASSVGGGDKFLQIRLNTHICALNGIHSASTACSSLDLLRTQIGRIVTEFCGSLDDAPVYKGNLIIPVIRYYLERESYNLPDSQHLTKAEEDARLHKILIQPINDCQLFHQFDKCDSGVLQALCQEMAHVLAELFLDVILSSTNPKIFTDWGSLLFSKEVRLVQNCLQALMQRAVSTAATSHQDQAGAVPILMSQWERLTQAVAVLQLEKPSDWSSYYQSTSVLSSQELKGILSLRVDFSSEAIERVVDLTEANSHNE
ncbi:hypothetical protein FRACYDRAFT_237298 [Fragilariopsis cylindrus CCMP1102]|uniref:Uncharacterized protein n=1 Tax=Fragilariopsis cylindrus CCMP1102 TaxID=635003 RepID=A0A1E7FLH3_9STRA|nr:hypothetical protein FRACYDRAFT_237298 [Fragilariopsis cylindrus CCMP1102]|eukprot:OEU19006.1 hypothetical protein FRACYDRAFT_237298 [Fragilariopsis cylindrus CCMP1102]